MESAADEGTFGVQQDRDSQFILSLTCSLSSIKISDTEEDNNNIIDKMPNADTSAAVVSADNNNEEAENDQLIIIDKIGKTSDTSDGGGEHKAKFQQVLVPKTESPCCDPLCAAASHNVKLPDSGASEHGGTMAAHAPLHPHTAMRTVTIPQVKDVLFGRNQTDKSHLGNQVLWAICDSKRRIYNLTDRDDKMEITHSIIHKIKSSGGSFLHFSKELQVWLVTGNDEACHKVGHMIQNSRPQPLGRLEPKMFLPVTTTKH